MCPVPPRQQPYQIASQLGFAALRAHPPTPERLAALGAEFHNGRIALSALTQRVWIDLDAEQVLLEDGRGVRAAWALLAIHYLAATKVQEDRREVSLAAFTENRGYISVFRQRIIGRFLGTVGRTSDGFIAKSEEIGGVRYDGPGVGYRFQALPRVPITLIRHAGDDEFGPDATVIYQADIERLLPAEDRVVVVELLLDTLAGKPFTDREGT
ncbi:MAG: hypothetical protein BWY76_02499 [bacterium ADurb.Bin429]|nr:MAG: hypothetical protein BWY76_02499 [bacterium ADurb.Bin429]